MKVSEELKKLRDSGSLSYAVADEIIKKVERLEIAAEQDSDFDEIKDDVLNDELIDELANRLSSGQILPYELDGIKSFMTKDISDFVFFEVNTLDDEMKIEHLNKVFSKYTANELENLTPERP